MKLIFLFSAFLAMTNAFGECNYTMYVPMITYIVSDLNTTAASTISLTRAGSSESLCDNFFLGFSKGKASSYNRAAKNDSNASTLNYNLFKNSNTTGVLKNSNDITSPNETVSDAINKNETKTYTYYFALNSFASNLPAAGTYYDEIRVESNSGSYNHLGSHEEDKDLQIQIVVPKFTGLALVDTGGTYDPSRTSKTLDFGELQTAKELSFDLRVVSNAGYNIKVSSVNNGTLKRVGGVGTTSTINYGFYSNGNIIGLSNSSSAAVSIASGTGVTPSQGVNIPIRVVIGSVDATKDSGTYQDYITLTTVTSD